MKCSTSRGSRQGDCFTWNAKIKRSSTVPRGTPLDGVLSVLSPTAWNSALAVALFQHNKPTLQRLDQRVGCAPRHRGGHRFDGVAPGTPEQEQLTIRPNERLQGHQHPG